MTKRYESDWHLHVHTLKKQQLWEGLWPRTALDVQQTNIPPLPPGDISIAKSSLAFQMIFHSFDASDETLVLCCTSALSELENPESNLSFCLPFLPPYLLFGTSVLFYRVNTPHTAKVVPTNQNRMSIVSKLFTKIDGS